MNTYVGGVAVGGLQPWNPNRGADFAAVAAAHATWLRSDLSWEYLEPAYGVWSFDLYDPVVGDALAAGLRVLALLHTTPDWANGGAGDYGLPTAGALLTKYAYQVGRRYLPMGVNTYEIGNEVNLPHPGWVPNGATYTTRLLAPCVTGLRRAAAELGLHVTVLFGSLAPTGWTGGVAPTTFLRDAYNSGARGLFDALAWHPYTGSDAPAASPHMTTDPVMLHTIMAAQGDPKQVWATEYGVPSGGPYSVTEQQQAATLQQALPVWYGHPFAGPLLWYCGRDTGTSPDDREQHFGLLRYDGTPKPAHAALAGLLTT